MAMTRVIDVLHVLLRPPDEDSDGEVLQRFVTQRDEAAFAELVRRPESDVSRCCVRLIPQFESEFAEGWVESAETTFLLPRIAAIGTVPD